MKNTAAVLICLFLAALSLGATITVDDDGPADFNNIQAAIDVAADGDTVEVQPGTYTGPGNRDIEFKGKAITVRSIDPNDPSVVAVTVVEGSEGSDGLHRGFAFRSGEGRDSVLEGLTIRSFYAPVMLVEDDP